MKLKRRYVEFYVLSDVEVKNKPVWGLFEKMEASVGLRHVNSDYRHA